MIREDASNVETLAAQEVRRYVYLRSGKLLEVTRGASVSDRIVVTCKNSKLCGELGRNLEPQQYEIKTATDTGTWWIVGGDEMGALYGAYRFAAKLGVGFGLEGDVLPDEQMGSWPVINESAKPRFALRGLHPFHDFSVGPDWWNLHDYESILSQMPKLGMNFIGFHTYPSWNPSAGPEANIWIGLPEDVDVDGNVKAAYEAGVVTTKRGWEVKPYPTGGYACGAGLLFEADDFGPDFMQGCMEWPKTEAACVAMFNRYGDMQRLAFEHARRLGIRTCVGTEIPLGVPPMLQSRLAAKGLNPGDPAVIRKLYEGTFLRVMRKMPVDYFWLYAPEILLGADTGAKGWEIVSKENVERDLAQIGPAAAAAQATFGFATCGWRLGLREDPFWLDKRVPKSWAASSINTSLGNDPVEKHYGAMTGRPKWAIGWAEDDGTPGANCCTCLDLQLWAARMFRDAADARRYGCDGMMAIHWRTAAISPNISALAKGGWDITTGATGDANAGAQAGAPAAEDMDAFWSEWGRAMFGGEGGAAAGRILQKFDGAHGAINSLYNPATSDNQFSQLFAPVQELEALRGRINGAGNLSRYDYWIDMIKATRARAETWVLSNRLGAKINQAKAIPEAAARLKFARDEVLPLRLAVARKHEETIAAFLRCAKSPGEMGTIAHLEYGVRNVLVSSHDGAIKELLDGPLPPDAAVSGLYHGSPRIFVSSARTQVKVGEEAEIRPFVLSSAKANVVELYWRPLGSGAFAKVRAAHQARQAYRVKLPARSSVGAVEYYLEAKLDDGRKVVWPVTAPAINQTVIAW